MSAEGPYATAPGPRYRWSDWTVWAEDGYVFAEDQSTGEFHIMTCAEAKEKLVAYADMAAVFDKRRDTSGDLLERAGHKKQYDTLRGFIEAFAAALKDAEGQGDPTRDEVRINKLKAFLRSRRAGREADAVIGAGLAGTAESKKMVFRPRVSNPGGLPGMNQAPSGLWVPPSP